MENDVEDLINRLTEAIETYDHPLDEVSWGYQIGVLISGNEAKLIIEKLSKL